VAFTIIDVEVFTDWARLLGEAACLSLHVPLLSAFALLRFWEVFAKLVVPLHVGVGSNSGGRCASAFTAALFVVSIKCFIANCDKSALFGSAFTSAGVVVPVS